MIAIFFVIFVAAAVSMNPVEQAPPPPPEPAPVVIEKTVVIECVPLGRGERLERDLTIPFKQRRFINPKGDGCLKKIEASVVTSLPVPESQSLEEERP